MRTSLLRSALALSALAYACGGVVPERPGDGGLFADAGTSDDGGSAAIDGSVQDASIVPGTDGGTVGPDTDAGLAPADGGVALPDSSVVPTDGGVAPVVDAGAGPLDASVPATDGGAPPVDAGGPLFDAGIPVIDAAVPPFDAGVPTGDAGSGLGARVVFAHASPNFGSFGLCVGISGIPLVADTVKFPNLQAAPGSNFLLNLDNGTVSGSIAQATAFSSVVAYEQLTNTQLANAKIEYWAMKNVSAGTSCRSAFGFNPLSPSANARKLGEIAYASLKSGAGYVAAVTGCVTSGGTKSGNTNLCGPDYGSNTPNLKLSVVQVPSGPVGSGTVGASFVHLASSAVSRGLASATLKFAAQGGGTSNCPFRLTTIGTASYLTASPLANATFGGAVPLTASDVTSGSQFGVQVANGDGNICGNLASLTAPVVASLSAGGTPGTSYFTQQSGKSMVFLLIGDATVQNPANGGDWTDPWLRVIALPSSP
jgi:hypothetical protein